MAPAGEKEGFKVIDRRRFTADAEASEAEAAASETPRAEPPPEPPRPEADRPPRGAEPRPELPPASFGALVQMLAMSALDALGAIPGPEGQPREPDLPLARHGIDLLGVLEAKTRGNLTPEETRMLEQTLFDLRMLAVRAGRSR